MNSSVKSRQSKKQTFYGRINRRRFCYVKNKRLKMKNELLRICLLHTERKPSAKYHKLLISRALTITDIIIYTSGGEYFIKYIKILHQT